MYKSKKMAFLGGLNKKATKLSQSKTKSFCNGLQSICNGIVKFNPIRIFENESTLENMEVDFANSQEILIGENSIAEYCIAPYGKHQHSKGLQIVDAESAKVMGEAIKTLLEKYRKEFGETGNPLPVYRSHPDSDNFPNALDKAVYGEIKDVYAGENGVMAKIKWNADFSQLPKKLLFSPRWRMDKHPDGYRPRQLISIGLTNSPNIAGTDFANERKQKGNNIMLEKILKALGFTAEQAQAAKDNAEGSPTEEEILNKISELGKPSAPVKEEKVDDLANETLRNDLKVERQARAKLVIDNCIAEGRMSKSEETTALEVLCNATDFDATAKLFTSRQAVWKNVSKTEGLGSRNAEVAANEQAEAIRADKIQARAEQIMANEQTSYRDAYARAEKEIQ